MNFTFNSDGGQLFGELTGDHLPDKLTDFTYKLGIILDGELYSAPVDPKHDLPTAARSPASFTEQEVQDLVNVLNAGSLPAALTKEPISKLYSGATLGSDTIEKSTQRDDHRVDPRAAVHALVLPLLRHGGQHRAWC